MKNHRKQLNVLLKRGIQIGLVDTQINETIQSKEWDDGICNQMITTFKNGVVYISKHDSAPGVSRSTSEVIYKGRRLAYRTFCEDAGNEYGDLKLKSIASNVSYAYLANTQKLEESKKMSRVKMQMAASETFLDREMPNVKVSLESLSIDDVIVGKTYTVQNRFSKKYEIGECVDITYGTGFHCVQLKKRDNSTVNVWRGDKIFV